MTLETGSLKSDGGEEDVKKKAEELREKIAALQAEARANPDSALDKLNKANELTRELSQMNGLTQNGRYLGEKVEVTKEGRKPKREDQKNSGNTNSFSMYLKATSKSEDEPSL